MASPAREPQTHELVLTSEEAKPVIDAIAAGRKVAGIWLHGAVSELLSHRHDPETGDLWLTFSTSDPPSGSSYPKLVHVTVDGQRI
jgi:hypothetical protein